MPSLFKKKSNLLQLFCKVQKTFNFIPAVHVSIYCGFLVVFREGKSGQLIFGEQLRCDDAPADSAPIVFPSARDYFFNEALHVINLIMPPYVINLFIISRRTSGEE